MEFKRIILYLAITIVGVFLWNAWMKDHPSFLQKETPSSTESASSSYVPKPYVKDQANAESQYNEIKAQSTVGTEFITVKTDVLNTKINLLGGDLVVAELIKYPEAVNTPHLPVKLLNDDPSLLYVLQSGFTTTNNSSSIKYESLQKNYVMADGQQLLTVTLKGKTDNGLEVTKSYLFERGKYSVKMTHQLNSKNKNWEGGIYQQIARRNAPIPYDQHSRTYIGAAISSPDRPYEKLSFKKLNENNVNRSIKSGWVAMQQQYFLTAWIPDPNQEFHYYSHVSSPTIGNLKQKIYTIGYLSPQIILQPNKTYQLNSTFYVGPEITKDLQPLAKGLDLTIDYGWLWIFSKMIFWLMDQIHTFVGNWGWSIVIVTLIIKLLLYHLSAMSYRSMVRMREIQPRIQNLKERFGEDRQALTKATMELYRKEKVNPMGGCLPMVAQIPVFFALYYVLIESVQLRQAPFIFWIQDLSVRDPYFVLPILMGVSMFIQQRLNPPPPDPTQAKVMMFLPLIFTVFFLSFPSGLVLYWLVNNCAGILQQWYIMKTYNPSKVSSKKRSIRKKKLEVLDKT